MERKNRIRRFLEEQPVKSSCVVVSSITDKKVILSYMGSQIVWEWRDGELHCPGANSGIDISPYAAEALVTEEINALFRIEGIDEDKISFVDEDGRKTPGVIIVPERIDTKNMEDILKVEIVKGLLKAYINSGDVITEEMIHVAIGNEVLGPFLSIINSY
jgi:hypothetical protein